jgi:hypothetical protein
MKIVASCRLKVHTSARSRFDDWLKQHARSYAALKAELESSQGHPTGAMAVGNGRWVWDFGGTFVSYMLKDMPIRVLGTAKFVPQLVDRRIVITDIFAV